MKELSILITIVLLHSISSINIYNLTNGTELKVDSLKSKEIYDFYIEISLYQVANFTMAVNDMTSTPFSSIIIYEYSNTSLDHINQETQSIQLIKNDSELISSFLYEQKKYITKYIAFRIEPINDIDYIKIKIDYHETAFNISEGVSQNITELKADIRYHFIIPAKMPQTINVNVTMNFVYPMNEIYVYKMEYGDRYTLYDMSNYDLSDSGIFIRYKIDNSMAEYFDFGINEPLSDINYVIVKMDFEYDIDLIKLQPNNITISEYGYDYPYNLFIPATQFQNATINLTMDYFNVEPFEYIYIQEYSDKKEAYLKTKNISITNSTDNQKLILNFSYIASDLNTQYIAVKFKLNDHNIKYIIANTIVEGGAYNLYDNLDGKIMNLKPGYSYYLFLETIHYQSFNLTMNYTCTNPISSVNVYEYSNRNSIDYLREKYQETTSSTQDNNHTSLVKYYVEDQFNDTKYVAVKITPNYTIDYILAKFKITKHKLEISEGLSSDFHNLEPGDKYYYYILMKDNERKIKVNLNMDNTYDNPISQLDIFELKSNDDMNSYEKKVEMDVTNIKYTSALNFDYKTSNDNIKTVVLKIIPKYYIHSMSCSISYSNMFTKVIINICAILLLLAIIIAITCFIRKCKRTNTSNIIESQDSQPLFEEK